MSGETACQRCGEVGEDRRILWMSCFYAMDELGLPFDKKRVRVTEPEETGGRDFYTLRVCKDCRAAWMAAIREWFNGFAPRESPGSGIFVRELGANVEISEEEWKRRHGDRVPVRVKR